MSKLNDFIVYLNKAQLRYRSEQNIPATTTIVLEFMGDELFVIHCGNNFLGVPKNGDVLFKNSALFVMDNGMLHLISNYTELSKSTITPITTNFSSNIIEFLQLSIGGANTISDRQPHQYSSNVTYQTRTGAQVHSNIAAEFSIRKGGEYCTLSTTGVLTAKELFEPKEVEIQARFITPQGNRFATKRVMLAANSSLVADKLVIFGSSSVVGGESIILTAAIRYTNGSNESVAARWYVDKAFVSIADGVLSTKNVIGQTANVTVTAQVNFKGTFYTAVQTITVLRQGASKATVRYGTTTKHGSLTGLTAASTTGTRQVTVNITSEVGRYATIAWPIDLGVSSKILNKVTGSTDDFEPFITANIAINGEPVAHYVTQAKFENLSGIWEIL